MNAEVQQRSFNDCHWSDRGVYIGQLKDDKPHGKGKMIYRDGGDIYDGEWKDGKPHGKGKMTYLNGDVYEGEVVCREPHGQGTYTWANGRKYEGEVVGREPHGNGKMTYPDGNVYTGQWKDGKKHGHGTYTIGDIDIYRAKDSTSIYEGEWSDDKKHGTVIVTNGDGRTFIEEWRDDKCKGWWKDDKTDCSWTLTGGGRTYHGEGNGADHKIFPWHDGRTHYDYDGKLWQLYTLTVTGYGKGMYKGAEYEGQWKGGKPHGNGIMDHGDGTVSIGEWKDGRHTCSQNPNNNKGIFTWKDGRKYDGQWYRGKPNGNGKMTYPDGNVYTGQWKDGKQNDGNGEMTYSNGNVYTGQWKDGKQNDDNGKMTYSNGDVHTGQWKDGEMHGLIECTKKRITTLQYYVDGVSKEAMQSSVLPATQFINRDNPTNCARMLITNKDVSDDVKKQYYNALRLLDNLQEDNNEKCDTAIETIGQLIQGTQRGYPTPKNQSLLASLKYLSLDDQEKLYHPANVQDIYNAIESIMHHHDEKIVNEEIVRRSMIANPQSQLLINPQQQPMQPSQLHNPQQQPRRQQPRRPDFCTILKRIFF